MKLLFAHVQAFCIIVVLSLWSQPIIAHNLEPIFISIYEIEKDELRVNLAMPTLFDRDNYPNITANHECDIRWLSDIDGILQCNNALITSLEITYPIAQPSGPTMIHYHDLQGSTELQELDGSNYWQRPEQLDQWSVYKRYTQLGFEHIFAGFDHVLFIFCLLMLSNGFRKTAIMLTGFTLSHSLTLYLAAYKWIQVPINAVEVIISLSLLMMAIEIINNNKQSLIQRYPFIVSSLFGLLHGMGFATVLINVGLPQEHHFIGLLFFNAGVELAQLTIIITWFMILTLSRKLQFDLTMVKQHHTVALTAIGGLSVYWLIDRSILWLSPLY
ncbi:HupE/UreJ family protein [Photobacterium minamisatsumaniensis]|uniref:HupE/UreJ family protein n=1 Tax=Photobacterium minamisatsumaniensis TaxID=2910233 RepID=UPI003D0F9E09